MNSVMIACIVFAAMTAIQPSASAAEKWQVRLPFIETNKWGYLDKDWKVAIAPKYETALLFSEGLAAVCSANKVTYIDSSGQTVIEQRDLPSSKMPALINLGGRRLYKPELQDMVSLSDGLAPFRSGNKYGFMNAQGKPAIDAKYDLALSFSEGLGGVMVGNKWGFIDKNGTIVIEPTFYYADLFSEGLAEVLIAKIGWGYIDKTGRQSIEAKYVWTGRFSDGMAPVWIRGSGWGFIDKTGAVRIAPRYEYAGAFREGLAEVMLSGKYGYINEKGELTIEAKYDMASPFQFYGHAQVWEGSRMHYIDKTGESRWQSSR